ncbi:tyrosine-protein kinase Fer-like isoform X1 [Styela clava]
MVTQGFDSQLLGKPSHEALVKLQDYELKLLDVIRKTVLARIKCDKDYAQSLLSVATTGGKIEPPTHSSPLYEAWQELVRNMSTLGQSFKHHSDKLQSATMDKIMNLSKDKHSIRKCYVEKREKMDSELIKIIMTELDKRHNHYVKTEKEASIAKRDYDQAVDKGKTPAIEKSQDKYKKGTMKLHQSHNDYVLHITEATHHQHYYRYTLLPELMGNLNYMQTEAAATLKEILLEFVQTTSPITDEICSSHREAESRVQGLISEEEYNDFIQTKATPLEMEAHIGFDHTLLKGEADKLPENELVLNALSIQGIEHACHTFQEDLDTVKELLDQDRQALQSLHQEIEQITNNLDNLRRNFEESHIGLLNKKLEYTNLKLKFVENEVTEKKLQEQHTKTSSCINSLGDSMPPPGLNLPALDTISTSSSTSDIKSPKTPAGGGGLRSIFPFKQKSTKTQKDSKNNIFDTSKDIRDQEWFHGSIPRNEANALLLSNGDFLLRESHNSPGDFVLSVLHEGTRKHFKVNRTPNGKFKFEVEQCNTIVELVESHYTKGLHITKQSQCIIAKPIVKDKWSLSHADLELGARLGRGNFGDVFRAYFKNENIDVAVKTCRENVDQRTRDKFLMEARILKGYDHPNIVRLIGVCTDMQPVYIVMELVPGGDLTKHLKKSVNMLQSKQLVKMCMDSCSGLNYLEEKKCIHRDVAARNCLITDDGVVKITDFGMSREEEDGVYSVSGGMKQIPIKWTAPEAMNYGTYTHASDVWSFGVLVWEIFSYGKVPYPGQTNTQAREGIERGQRMQNPHGCPDRMYNDVMLKCWDAEPTRRPKFAELLKIIKAIKV